MYQLALCFDPAVAWEDVPTRSLTHPFQQKKLTNSKVMGKNGTLFYYYYSCLYNNPVLRTGMTRSVYYPPQIGCWSIAGLPLGRLERVFGPACTRSLHTTWLECMCQLSELRYWK